MINIAVLGYGTVGSGVVEVINKNHASINKRAGQEVNIKYVLDLRDFPGDPVEKVLVHDYSVIVNDPEVKIIVEVMGGIKPAYDFTRQALEAGKSVCTSNKELVAAHGAELLAIAKANNVNFLFEASVGGGIPIIRPLNQSLTADEITEITGILNGTTNYILSKMTDEGKSFEEVLKRAQEKGYAERNPEADVEGYDACRKIAILTSLALGKQVDYQDIYTEGITKITKTDIEYAKALHASIKLLGTSKWEDDGKIYSMVAPFMIDSDHPLGHVNGVFNGIFVHGNVLGDAMFYGSGAGKLPTASAVVADVIDCVKHIDARKYLYWEDGSPDYVDNAYDETVRLYVRATSDNFSELEAQYEAIFPGVSCVKNKFRGEIAFITDSEKESLIKEKISGFKNLTSLKVLHTFF